MDLEFKDKFLSLWKKYFNGAELPIAFYYTDQEGRGELVKGPATGHQCFIGVLNKARKGKSLCFGGDSFGCAGGKRYLGYARDLRPGFEIFPFLRNKRKNGRRTVQKISGNSKTTDGRISLV